MKLYFFACLALFPALSPAQIPGETKRPIAFQLTALPPVIDGDLSDAAWQSAPLAEKFYDRLAGGIAPEQTACRILSDAKNIYISFYCKDSDPASIMARETVRDSKYTSSNDGSSPNKEDNVTFSLDPFFTRKTADRSLFSVNAIGTRSVLMAGGRGTKQEWQGDWLAAVKRVSDGWTCEIQIPWGMLNYPSISSPTNMGINFFRFQNRTKVESAWSNIGPSGFEELSGIWTGVIVPKHKFTIKPSFLPYLLAGDDEGRFTFRSGVDVRVPLTPELTNVDSINPDFGTIEGAVEGIQFTRAERFIPERRPFFLEGEDYFSSGTRFNDVGAFFLTRVGSPRSTSAPSSTASSRRKTRSGCWTRRTSAIRNDFVTRYQHDLSETSQAGFLVAQRKEPGDTNSTAVLDQHWRRGKIGFESQLGRTWGTGADGGMAVLSTTYENGPTTGLFQCHTLSEFFNPKDGFIPYRGYSGTTGFWDFNPQYKSGPARSFDAGMFFLAFNHLDGSRYWHSGQFFTNVLLKNDWYVGVSGNYDTVDGQIDNTYRLQLSTDLQTASAASASRMKLAVLEMNRPRLSHPASAFGWRRALTFHTAEPPKSAGHYAPKHRLHEL